ncbi:MAG TPA: hypothetical protein PK705_04545 [Clostridia bacterium]|nr:hypothetical protein [Clostridia bacterium]HQO69777.1 hypothetical protein [Clostridia bacterium]
MDEKKKVILKRILAWVYLVLFVFVILNLMIFDFYKDVFLFAYIALLIVYFLIFRNTPADKSDIKDKEDNTNKK